MNEKIWELAVCCSKVYCKDAESSCLSSVDCVGEARHLTLCWLKRLQAKNTSCCWSAGALVQEQCEHGAAPDQWVRQCGSGVTSSCHHPALQLYYRLQSTTFTRTSNTYLTHNNSAPQQQQLSYCSNWSCSNHCSTAAVSQCEDNICMWSCQSVRCRTLVLTADTTINQNINWTYNTTSIPQPQDWTDECIDLNLPNQ